MKYEFRSLATGRMCCRSNDVRNLCPQCRAQAGRTTTTTAVQRTLTTAGSHPNGVPPPPDLMKRLREAARSPVPSQRLLEVHEVLREAEGRTGVPAPPDLTEMIRRLREK